MHSLVLQARSVTQATPRSRIIVADLGEHRFAFHAGQSVFAGLADGQVRRPYSIACAPVQSAAQNMIELLVQIDDHAAPDPHLERVAPGTLLHIEGPFGSFELVFPIGERRLLLIAGGTGIAPLRSMMWETFARQPEIDIAVLYSARSREEFAYSQELESLAADGRIELAMTVTRVSEGWSGVRGRIQPELLESVLTPGETRCIVCGPSGFVAGSTALLRQAGVAAEQILTETYAVE